MLLVDDGPDWPYTSIHMSDTVLHMPLSDNRHIGTMTDGVQYKWLWLAPSATCVEVAATW